MLPASAGRPAALPGLAPRGRGLRLLRLHREAEPDEQGEEARVPGHLRPAGHGGESSISGE